MDQNSRDDVDVLQHAEHFASCGYKGHMPLALVEHVEQDLAAKPVS
jgi:hypothetical protein